MARSIRHTISAQRRTAVTRGRTRRLVVSWIVLVVLIVITGTLGYMAIGGWNLSDALFMTVTTVTTVGLREVQVLDTALRIWTMLLAVVGVAIIFGTISIVVEEIVRATSDGKHEERKMENRIAALYGHYILCGYGRVGTTVAREMRHAGNAVVVCDSSPESLARALGDGYDVVTGDATSDEILIAAGIERASGLIATMDSDANNVFVILSARTLNPGLYIVGRANSADTEAKILRAGADRVVSPYTMAGRRLAELATRPFVVDFIDQALSHGHPAFALEEILIDEGSLLLSTSVSALRGQGVFVLAIVSPDHTYAANPLDDRSFAIGETAIVSGRADILAHLTQRP